jgi:hypothetical protein
MNTFNAYNLLLCMYNYNTVSSNIQADRSGFLGGRRGPLGGRFIIYASNYYARGPHHYICR